MYIHSGTEQPQGPTCSIGTAALAAADAAATDRRPRLELYTRWLSSYSSACYFEILEQNSTKYIIICFMWGCVWGFAFDESFRQPMTTHIEYIELTIMFQTNWVCGVLRGGLNVGVL